MSIQLNKKIVDIPLDEPFQNDRLNRKSGADILTRLVSNLSDSTVMCISAPWGFGKTTFLRMWQAQLKKDGFRAVYFDAWESDFCSDPMTALIGEIGELMREDGDVESTLYKRLKENGTKLLKVSLPAAVKLATYGLVDVSSIKSGSEVIATATEELAKQLIQDYESRKDIVKEFKNTLAEYADNQMKPDQEGKKPLIFIIDELDRCRPNYALEILESVKHLFNIPNIIFILGADKQQLTNSIKTVYGSEINAKGYLDRFINLDYTLPEPDPTSFCKALVEESGLKSFLSQKQKVKYGDDLCDSLSKLASNEKMSLRCMERCFGIASLAIRLMDERDIKYAPLLSLLVVLKFRYSDVYELLKETKLSSRGFFNYLNEHTSLQDFLNNSGYKTLLQVQLHYYLEGAQGSFNHLVPDQDPDEIRHIGQRIQELDSNRENIIARLFAQLELAGSFSRNTYR